MATMDPALRAWLSSAENPAARYLVARDLDDPRPDAGTLAALRREVLAWAPLGAVLALQREDGGFGAGKKADARATLWALRLLGRCGLDVTDPPVERALAHLEARHVAEGALSYTTGGSGVLPCYLGVTVAELVAMGALESPLVQGSLAWLVAHQRFDDAEGRAGGEAEWGYRAPANYGCWQSVSCFHGVAGAFRALAAVPAERRTSAQRARLDEAVGYLRRRHLYKKRSGAKALFRHLLEPALVADYRSTLLDLLHGVADADPRLASEAFVRAAIADFEALTDGGRVPLAKNYGRALMSPVPLEPVGEPSRLLTAEWLAVRARLVPGA
ncbi:MAG: hypothetical protein EP329_10730 [Deltaproteobacteria bacterium]|nr:MAG: hypothetical protein EP329_10730 [Deltaproteobacteria bacterium]